MYKTFYPWQNITRRSNLSLTFKFNYQFDENLLLSEFNKCREIISPKTQFDVYHNGGWSGICLHSLDGDANNDMGGEGNYDYTHLIEHTPYIKSILDEMPGIKQRVRILIKKPGTNIYWHTDENETLDKGLLRLHIPIITNDNYEFQLSHIRCDWKPGELWYGDFSFPHRLRNQDSKDINAHLVIDIKINNEMKSYLGSDFFYIQDKEKNKRSSMRNKCDSYYYFYNLFFDLKRYKIILFNKINNIIKTPKSI